MAARSHLSRAVAEAMLTRAAPIGHGTTTYTATSVMVVIGEGAATAGPATTRIHRRGGIRNL